MSKYGGFMITTVISGIIIPVALLADVASKDVTVVVETSPVYSTEEEIPVSEVKMFTVDYDMYGSYEEGKGIVCRIYNDMGNPYSCEVWIEDEGQVISNKYLLGVSDKLYVIEPMMRWEEPGEYNYVLVYNVNVDKSSSRIECPFVVLVNGGSYVE